MEPLISVIIPAYNVEKHIKKCLNSVLQQTYRNIEAVIIDDGSTDETNEICRGYADTDSRVQLWYQENNGTGAARNLGLRKARGQYIGFVDGDDYLEPGMYEVLLRYLLNNNASIANCGLVYESEGRPAAVSLNNQENPAVCSNYDLLLTYLQSKELTCVCNKLYTRSAALQLFPDLVIGEDAVYLFEVLLNPCTVVSIDNRFYHYVQRRGSARITKFNPNHLDSLRCAEMVVDRICDSCPQLLPHALAFQFKYYIGTLARIYVWDVEQEYQETVTDIAAKIRDIYMYPQKSLIPGSKRASWLCYCLNKSMFRLIMKQYYRRTLYKVMEING